MPKRGTLYIIQVSLKPCLRNNYKKIRMVLGGIHSQLSTRLIDFSPENESKYFIRTYLKSLHPNAHVDDIQ